MYNSVKLEVGELVAYLHPKSDVAKLAMVKEVKRSASARSVELVMIDVTGKTKNSITFIPPVVDIHKYKSMNVPDARVYSVERINRILEDLKLANSVLEPFKTKSMTKEEVNELEIGLYQIYWKSGGFSLASVGVLHDGTKWMAPCNWTSHNETGVTTTNWEDVEKAILICKKEDLTHEL